MISKNCSRCKKRRRLNHGYCEKCRNEYHAEYYRKNRKRLCEAERQRRLKDPEKMRAKSRHKNRLAKLSAIEAYGGKCQCCGESNIEFLSIDHINGGGRQHRISVSSPGCAFYLWLRRNGYPKKEFRALCCNCNQSIGLYGYCPHKSQSKFPESVAAVKAANLERRETNSRKLTIDGVTMTVVGWSLKSGLTSSAINQRLRLGWNEKDAVWKPLRITRVKRRR